MLIDSHHHLWKYSAEQYGWINDQMSVLKKDFLTPELNQIASDSGVDGFVSVQASQTIAETDDLLAIAAGEPLIKGVVGWVPLASATVADDLDKYADVKMLKGVRHVVQDEPDLEFILGADFNRGVSLLHERGLVYDILIFAKQLTPSIEFVDRHPDQPFVLDHIAKPTIRSSEFHSDWESGIRDLARRENVTCKFSGIVTEVQDETWNTDTVRRYWDVSLEAFGSKRLMFGSDWPVCLLRSGHKQWLDTVRELASTLSAAEQADFFAGNATRAYSL